METLVSQRTTILAGPSSSTARSHQRGFSSSRTVSSASQSAPAFVVCGRLCSEHHQRLVASYGTKERTNGMAEKRIQRISMPISRESDASIAAGNPKLAARSSCTNNRYFHHICRCQQTDQETAEDAEDLAETWGVQLAIAALRFYKNQVGTKYVMTTALVDLKSLKFSGGEQITLYCKPVSPLGRYHPYYQEAADTSQLVVSIQCKPTGITEFSKELFLQPGD